MRAYFFWKSNSTTLSFGFAFRRHGQAHFFDPRDRRFRTFITVVLSVLLHILVLWLLFRVIQLSQGGNAGPTVQTLTVSLADNAKKAASPTPQVEQQPAPETPPPPAESERTRRNIISSRAPSPIHVPLQSRDAPLTPLPPLPPLPQSNQPPQPDMNTQVNQARDAREAALAHERDLENNGGTGESDSDKAKRVIASNLKYAKGKDYEQGGGGVFDVKDKGLHDATLIFHGWNRDLSRNFGKEIVVKQGTEPNIDSAIVNQVILIIREQYNGDFVWDSQRLGKSVTRSARKEDEAALKEFLYQEFSYIENIDLNRGPPPEAPPRRGR